MVHNREEILRVVIECLSTMQRCCPSGGITEQCDPIRHLGCDSPDGLDFACAVEEKLGIHIPEDVNPLVDDKAKRGRKVGDIVTLLERMAVEQEANCVPKQ